MIQDTSVLLIVVGISTAAYAADKYPNLECQCERTSQVVVALNRDSTKLSFLEDVSGKDQTNFRWLPHTKQRKWVYLVIHHSATDSGSVESIHNSHVLRKDRQGLPWLGIGYHFVIGNGSGMEDGKVESTFRWEQQIHGAHSGSVVHNANGIGICLIGNFEHRPPTRKQIAAVTDLVGQLSRQFKIPSRLVIGHNTVKPTACPGKLFPLQDVKRNSFADGNKSSKTGQPILQLP